MFKRNKQPRILAQPHRTVGGNNNTGSTNDKYEKQRPSTSAAAYGPTRPTRLEPISDIEEADGGPNMMNKNEHHSEPNASNAKMLNDKYHWHNTRSACNIAHTDTVGNGDMRAQAERILAQTTGIFARALRVIHNEDVVDRFFEPEKSSADAAEHITYFEGRFHTAVDELTANVHVNTRNLPDGTEQQQIELLTELVLMKEKIQSLLIRIRAESAGAFAANQKYDRAVAYKQLSDYGAIAEKQSRVFYDISTALAGIHYAKLLDDIQRKIADVRAKLPNHRVLYATVAQQSVKDSRNKVDKLFRRLRPDIEVGRQPNIKPQANMQTEQPNTQVRQQQQTNAKPNSGRKQEHADANVATRPNSHDTINAESGNSETRADVQTTKPKLTYAQALSINPTQPRKPNTNASMNNRNASILGRPPQRNQSSNTAYNNINPCSDWPGDRRATKQRYKWNEHQPYHTHYATSAARNYGCTRFVANGYSRGSRMHRNGPTSTDQRHFPDWIAQNLFGNEQYAYERPRYGSDAENASNLYNRRSQVHQKFHGAYTAYVGRGGSAGRW
jgi:hypothetical protein